MTGTAIIQQATAEAKPTSNPFDELVSRPHTTVIAVDESLLEKVSVTNALKEENEELRRAVELWRRRAYEQCERVQALEERLERRSYQEGYYRDQNDICPTCGRPDCPYHRMSRLL